MHKELTLEEIHAELLEQLEDITNVCTRHGISYNLMCIMASFPGMMTSIF